jgi:hypothetical protein
MKLGMSVMSLDIKITSFLTSNHEFGIIKNLNMPLLYLKIYAWSTLQYCDMTAGVSMPSVPRLYNESQREMLAVRLVWRRVRISPP